MPFEMRNLTEFPIGWKFRLCFDSKLEILEQLDAEDVVELVKVNQGFQSMISNRPSIVFGHHVHEIRFPFGWFGSHEIEAIEIQKLDELSSTISLDAIRNFPLIKNIHSSNNLVVSRFYDPPSDESKTFLKQLEAVDQLVLLHLGPPNFEFFFHRSIKEYARLHINFPFGALSKYGPVEHFIETQLNECEIVVFECDADYYFHFYYKASMKTHIKQVQFDDRGSLNSAEVIQWIVNHGIPSKNPVAVVGVNGRMRPDMKAAIFVFLTGYPEMKQISRKNRQPFIALANDYMDPPLNMKTLCFRRSIDATRDCVYMLTTGYFFAFYIKPDEMIDH